jgi:excisionase family DNA binding protein
MAAATVTRRIRAGGVTGHLLTARAVAELLGVSTETVLRWVRRGELTAIRLPGGALRFHEAALNEWLAAHATPSRGVPTTAPGVANGTLSSAALTTTGEEE